MADEKRRLIYELLVEAKGAAAASGQLDGFGKQLEHLGGIAKGAFGILAAGFALHGIAEALDEMTKFKQVMAGLGVSGEEASKGLEAVQAIAFTTMNSMKGVSEVYTEAIHLQEQMGRSAEDAARTTNAFIRIANSEGKSVQQAAAQIKALGFALERGAIPAKEFIGLMKESPTFSKAAAEALGITTQALAAMAKQGDLGAEAITRIILGMEKVGEQTAAAATVGGITESLKTLASTMVQATAAGAGFSATLDSDNAAIMLEFIGKVNTAFNVLGGTIRVISNALQLMFDVAALSVNVQNPFGPSAAESWKHYKQEVSRDLDDMAKGAHTFVAALSDEDALAKAAAAAKEKMEKAARDAAAIEKGRDADRVKAFGSTFDEHVKTWQKGLEEVSKERAKQAEKDAEYELEKHQEMLEEKWRGERVFAEMKKQLGEQVSDYLKDFEKKNEKDITESVKKLQDERMAGVHEAIFEQIDAFQEAAYLLKDTLADLFTGGIHNAREFFQTILQGLSRIFAQMLAMKMTESIMNVVKGAFANAGPTNWAALAGAANVSAKGNIFDHGARVPFAQGGIFSGPTVFPMASGGVGLMGEAGPEAVMPLARMGNGKLGVAASMPHIQIINQTGVAATARVQNKGDRMAIVLEAAHLGASMAEDRFNRSLRSGYGTAAQSVQTVYGLRRKV